MVESNEIIITDHRAYIVDINIEEYFNETFSKWDIINKRILHPSRRSHYKQFVVEIKELMMQFNVEAMIDRVKYRRAYHEELETIDKSITMILNKVAKKIEGLSRNIPYSKLKEIKLAQLLYWKLKVKLFNCQQVSYNVMEKRRKVA